jgi:DNA primase
MQLKEQSRSLLEAVTHYSQALDERAEEYLAGRGISRDVAKRFELGTVTDPINGHEDYLGYLSIPYITALGACVSVKFRRLDDGKPKYGQPTGQKQHLYNVSDVLISSARIVVCEGELDAVVVSGIINIPAVGVPGVTAWKPHFAKLFTGYDTVYIVGDNDQKEDGTNPGAEFSRRVQSEISNGVIVTLPPNMDINDFYLTNGVEETRKLFGGVK